MPRQNPPRDIDHGTGEDAERIATNNPPRVEGVKSKTVQPRKQGGHHAA